MDKIKISLSWSGGKDSALALWKLLNDGRYEVTGLHTTFGEQSRRVGMHGIQEELIDAHAAALGLKLDKIYYPASGDNAAYEKAMRGYLSGLEAEGIKHIAYGDILLEDLKEYREEKLSERGFSAIFPLWGADTKVLAEEFLQSGFKTKICAADADKISKEWVGRDYDYKFLEQLSADVDPCGENGEFHSFCYDGPVFSKPIEIRCKGLIQQSYNVVLENGGGSKKHYWFADLEEK
jgi:uncharacterized protein (TIGR00290 family)